MLKKILSLFVILILINSILIVNAEVGESEVEILIYDDFNTYTGGTPAGWIPSSLPTGVTGTSPVNAGPVHGNVLKLISTYDLMDGNIQRDFNPSITGKVVLEVKIWTQDVTHRRALFTFKDSNNKENAMVWFNSNGHITVAPNDQKVMLYAPEKWYHLQVVLDLTEKNYDLYIDGEKKLDKNAIANMDITNMKLLRFGQWDRDNAFCYLDDIMVYKADRILAKEELSKVFQVSFDDIGNHWAQQSIEHMANFRVLKKSADGKFHPDEKILRKDFAARYSV